MEEHMATFHVIIATQKIINNPSERDGEMAMGLPILAYLGVLELMKQSQNWMGNLLTQPPMFLLLLSLLWI